ncbi:hypothetical protein C6988_03670 [Nitrosopumilus sp. b1]|uniref:hypothetical protein n=1 Tax=Nitrosopumilus sp. b1 TaxID=2109907 RepID=UPI0015F5DC00|nr:hypothetical protein [Nitrosopumilus sp. b1]KAF6243352.1 hypothetical protein C6988_03670 [Nitrosopumilus sp. b1]
MAKGLNIKSILLLGSLSVLGIFSTLTDDAFAAVPQFDTFVAADPDNGDLVYSVGDTLTINFDIATNATGGGTMTTAEINANFTFASPDISGGGTTYTGLWSADSTSLTITITGLGNVPVISSTTVQGAGTTTIADADGGNTDLINVGADTATLSGNFGVDILGGGDCSKDCTHPTLGVDYDGKRWVEDGFVYNGRATDVEYFFTPYPLLKVNVGEENVATFKIYENQGPWNIKHFEFGFGLGKGEYMISSNAKIIWDKDWEGKETLTVYDPENVLQNVRLDTDVGQCNEALTDDNCLIVTIYHTFRAPLDFNIVGTQVWDERKNSWQNFYNHGIEIEGKSLNPLKKVQAMDNQGYLHTLTIYDKTHVIDEMGNTWHLKDGFWIKDYEPAKKIIDDISSHGYDRNHAFFSIYKSGQAMIAEDTLDQILLGQTLQKDNPGFETIQYNIVDRSNDIELQKRIIEESLKAEKVSEQKFSKKNHP